MFPRVVVLLGLLGAVFAAKDSLLTSRIQSVKAGLSNMFKTEVSDEASSNLRSSSSVTVESMAKYVNLYRFLDYDYYCDYGVVSEVYAPLDHCIPNFLGVTTGHFLKFSCDTSSWVCAVKGYDDNMCMMASSGTHHVSQALPSSCSYDSTFGTYLYFNFTSAMPYHSSGVMTKIYTSSDCTAKHVSFYTPDGVCETNSDGTAARMYCSDDYVNLYNDTYCDYWDGDETISEYLGSYDSCATLATNTNDDSGVGGSYLQVCGGINYNSGY